MNYFKVLFRHCRLCTNSDLEAVFFQNANGHPYSSASFTKRLQRLFERLTGRRVATTMLRSSFVTWAYEQRYVNTPRSQASDPHSAPEFRTALDSNALDACQIPSTDSLTPLLPPSFPSGCDDRMKESLAAALRHSREQAQHTYDRRTANEKKAAALELARRKAEQPSAEEGPSEPEPSPLEVAVGQFVGLVAEDSTLQKPSIFLGRVQAFLPDDQACLLWYKNIGGGVYSLQLDGTPWTESRQSLVPVEVAPAKGRPHAFRLRTSLRTIHKAVLDGGRDP